MSQSFIHLLIHWFVDSLVNYFIHLFIHAFINSFIHAFIHSFIHAFIRSFIHPFIHIFTHLHSFIFLLQKKMFGENYIMIRKPALDVIQHLKQWTPGETQPKFVFCILVWCPLLGSKDRASEKVWEKLEKNAILFQRSAIFAKKCEKVQFWPKYDRFWPHSS